MGIAINLKISKSVTKEEWEEVYGETLKLIKHFPLAEMRTVKIHGIDTLCLVKTEEREEKYDEWNGKRTTVGWMTVGDYQTLCTAEEYYLQKNLVDDNKFEADAGDALMGVLPEYMDYSWNDDRFNHTYDKWGAKTQGEPYHIYLLAVAALIEARLGRKAFTYGDITRGQFKRAVEIANRYLEKPIDLPDRCYMDRLVKRVLELPLSPREQLAVFERFFLGTKDAEFGKYMRLMFSEEVIADYWRNRFKNSKIGTYGFDDLINDYLLWGFELRDLCDYVNFECEEGENNYEKFIKRIMDAKLHLKDKDCADSLKIDQEEENPYGIATLFAQFVLAGAKNKKVDRYIPIEDIKSVLKASLASKCDVEGIIDSYLAEEAQQMEILNAKTSGEEFDKAARQDPANVLNQVMDIKKKQLIEEREKYDINNYEDLLFYETGDRVRPGLKKALAKSMKFMEEFLFAEERYKQLLSGTASACCEWLVEHNRYILVCDKHWDKAFSDIEKDIHSFGRYYSLLRADLANNDLVNMGKALFINDDLYKYSRELMLELKKAEE